METWLHVGKARSVGIAEIDHSWRQSASERTLRHGVARVETEIEDDLLKLGGVPDDPPKIRREGSFDGDVLGKGFLDDSQGGLDDRS